MRAQLLFGLAFLGLDHNVAVESSEHVGSLGHGSSVDSNSGRRSLRESRIYGGTPASTSEYPFFAIPKIVLFGKLCGSVKIWSDILLSAGHCSGAFRGHDVLIGGNQFSGSDAPETIPALSELVHPLFDEDEMNHDFMLVKLQRASVAPNVPWNTDPSVPLNGESVVVIGFGETEQRATSNILLEATVDVVDYATCRTVYGGILSDDTMLCAARMKTDTCSGDRYGMLVVQLLLLQRAP